MRCVCVRARASFSTEVKAPVEALAPTAVHQVMQERSKQPQELEQAETTMMREWKGWMRGWLQGVRPQETVLAHASTEMTSALGTMMTMGPSVVVVETSKTTVVIMALLLLLLLLLLLFVVVVVVVAVQHQWH